jgi:outer-membrane receptor for ferric coprogen and ferric-rhodotorulic acid
VGIRCIFCILVIGIVCTSLIGGTARSGETAAKISFRIPSQPLEGALREFAQQSGVQIIFFSEIAQGLQAPAITGEYTVAAALDALLAASKLTYRVINPKTIEILTRTPKGSSLRNGDRSPGDMTSPGQAARKTHSSQSPELDELVVAATSEGLVATRTETPLREVPQSLSIVSPEQIRQNNYADLDDALANAIGTTPERGDSLGQNFFVRGFAVSTLHVDGGAAFNSFDLVAEPFFGSPGLSEFDHIEILRGADGLFGGNGGPGATINLIRKRPLATPDFTVSAWTGSWNNNRVEADATGPLAFDGGLRGRLVADVSAKDYFYDIANLRRMKIFGVIEYDLTAHTLLTAGASYEWQNALPFVGGLPFYQDGTDPHLPRPTALTFDWANYDTRTREIYLGLTHTSGNHWKVKFNATSFDETARYDYGYFSSVVGPPSKALWIVPSETFSTRPNTLDQFACDATVTGEFDWLGHLEKVAFGADMLRFRGDTAIVDFYDPNAPLSNAYDYDPGTYPDPRFSTLPSYETDTLSSSNQSAVFGSVKVYLSAALSIIGGARISRDSAASEIYEKLGTQNSSGSFGFKTPTKVTPYGAILYDLNPRYTLYASYADIYQSNGLLRQVDGAFLPPIDGVNIEAGIKAAWYGGTLNGSLALYHIAQSGLPAEDDRARAGGVFVYGCCYLPTGVDRSKGIDLEFNGRVTSGWLIGTGYTYNTNADFDGGDLSTATPRHLFKLWTSVQLPGQFDHWTVGGTVLAQSGTFKENDLCQLNVLGYCVGGDEPVKNTQSAYAIVGARVGYEFDKHWRLALNINNFFDRVYYQTVGFPGSGNWYGEPRNFLLRADVRF